MIEALSRTERINLAEQLSAIGRRVVPVADLLVAIDKIATARGQGTDDAAELERIAFAIESFDPAPVPGVVVQLREVAARIRDYS